MIRINEYPTPDVIREFLFYEGSTGKFYWKKARKKEYVGKEAGNVNSDGYLRIRIKGVRYAAHRLAWILTFGPISDGLVIDHKNSVRSDNRIDNLRVGSQAENTHNSKLGSRNKSGHKGVCFDKKFGKWRADIRSSGKSHFLGHFNCPTRAMLVVQKARPHLHGAYARTS